MLDTLLKLDETVRSAEYTKESYAAYFAALGNAADRLKNEMMTLILIDDLKQRVFTAYSLLEKR